MFFRLSSMIRTVLVGYLQEALRESKYKGRTFAGNACDANRAAVQFDEALGKREPEAGAFGLAQVVAARLAELLEHQRLLVGRDADAGVDDRDLDARVPSTAARRARSVTLPPAGVNLTAFESRLMTTCLTLRSSADAFVERRRPRRARASSP